MYLAWSKSWGLQQHWTEIVFLPRGTKILLLWARTVEICGGIWNWNRASLTALISRILIWNCGSFWDHTPWQASSSNWGPQTFLKASVNIQCENGGGSSGIPCVIFLGSAHHSNMFLIFWVVETNLFGGSLTWFQWLWRWNWKGLTFSLQRGMRMACAWIVPVRDCHILDGAW